MAPPLYFLPKISRAQLAAGGIISREILRLRGLEAALADVQRADRDCALFDLTGPGPGGHSGCLLVACPGAGRDPGPRAHYAPDLQEWREVQKGEGGREKGDGGGLWIGLDRDLPPAPADLERRRVLPGYEVTLAGQSWTVPVIRDPQGGTGLPRDWTVAGDQVLETVKPGYRAAWEHAAETVALYFDPAAAAALPRLRAVELCIEALGVNYRVGVHEQNLLGLVDSENWLSVLAAAADVPGYLDLYRAAQQKKTELNANTNSPGPGPAAAASGSPGPAGCGPGTAPAAES